MSIQRPDSRQSGDLNPGRGHGRRQSRIRFDGTSLGSSAFRFVTTHLVETSQPAQLAQMQELLARVAGSSLPVVMAGDFNANADYPSDLTFTTYQAALDADFTDDWVAVHGNDPGFTCCQDQDLENPVSLLDTRIDLFLSNGGSGGRRRRPHWEQPMPIGRQAASGRRTMRASSQPCGASRLYHSSSTWESCLRASEASASCCYPTAQSSASGLRPTGAQAPSRCATRSRRLAHARLHRGAAGCRGGGRQRPPAATPLIRSKQWARPASSISRLRMCGIRPSYHSGASGNPQGSTWRHGACLHGNDKLNADLRARIVSAA